jgi:hypothetical protein
MQTFEDKQKNQLIKKFHALLTQAGIDNETKMVILGGYGVASSKELSCAELIDVCNKIYNNINHDAKEMDTLRKGALRAIFRNLELKHPGERFSCDYVKGIACRAAGCIDFNKINTNKLRGIYNAFCDQNRAYERMTRTESRERRSGFPLMVRAGAEA